MRFRHLIYPCLSVLLILISTQAQAAPLDSAGLLDDILNRFANVASTWAGTIQNYATWIFWSLAIISMVWTFAMMAMQGDGLSAVLAELVRFFAVLGFFFYLLKNGPAISTDIQDSLRQLAANASGLSKSFSPSGIVDIGFDIVSRVVDQSSIWSPADSTVGLILGGVILCVLALVGVNMLLLLITGWILSYAGIFLLGFGGARWTSDIAITFFKTVLGIALQLFTMVLIVGIGKSFIDQYYQAMGTGAVQMKSMFVMLVASIVLLVLVNKVPPLVGSIVGGASMQGIGGFGAGAIIGAAAAAGAAIVTAGTAAAAGAANAAGGASALKAAFESAQAAMAEESNSSGGASSVGSIGGGENTGSVDTSGEQPAGISSGSTSGGSQGFALSFSRASRMASHMANSLANGMAARNAAKHDSTIKAARDTIAQTPGGKLASQIRSQTAARQSSHTEESFDNENVTASNKFNGDSLGGMEPTTAQTENTGSIDTQNPQSGDEYEQFKNKSKF
ncbi:TPA: P-type conjugative transfer protein TrbL [Escherichia coli]|nr:P-type conjugative transfer protein TrbL [Escherichia coli]MED8811321.1 P-type conjugative transfer protein TrbL [Escherichia marmotae]